MGGDRRPQNNALSAAVDVGAPPSVVVASVDAKPEIAQILAARGVRTTVEPPASLPAVAAAYGSLDAVVLDDVPANLLGKRQIAALATAVRAGGLGLLTLGGKHAYSLGGYARSPLNQVLPVASLVPGDLQRRNLAIELVLDRSGSMSDSSGGVRKITMAQSAARQTAQFVASHRDELGVVAFDIVPHQLISLQRVSPGASAKRVLSRIAGLKADGGTDIYLGLQAGLHQILASKSPNRHMILLTDGISQPHDYTGLLKQFAQHKISVATVALGTRRRRRPPARDRSGDRRQLLHDQQPARPAEDLRQGDASEREARAGRRAPAGAAAGQQPGRALARRTVAAPDLGQRRHAPARRARRSI